MRPVELTPADREILIALGAYRLLTISQIVRLGISGRKNAGVCLARLVRLGYVDRSRASAQTSGVHWLTPKAAKHYGEFFGPEWVRSASAKGFAYGLQMPQRLAIVDVCISLRMWAGRAGCKVVSLRTDFEKGDDKLQRATRLEWPGCKPYTPDALGEILDANGEPWAFAIEVETGGYDGRIDNFAAKLEDRLEVMRSQMIDRAQDRPRDGRTAARMLFIFGNAEMLQEALKLVAKREPTARHWRTVFFKTLPEIVENFGGEWLQSTGELRPPFSRIDPKAPGSP